MTDYKLVPKSTVDELAQFIRKVDGNHKMGAGALADKICERFSVDAPAVQGEPVGWQFYQHGKWWNGDDRIKDHKRNTQEAGFRVRDVYAAQQPVEQQPDVAQLVEALARCRHQASYSIGGEDALRIQLGKVRDIVNQTLSALAAHRKQGGGK